MVSKTPLIKDVKMRALEEFAEYWPNALRIVDQSKLQRMGVSMPMMIDVFRSVWTQAFIKAAIIQLQELGEDIT